MSRRTSAVRLSRRVASHSMLSAALLALAACGVTLDMSGVETSIRDGIGQQKGLVMESVTCPHESRAAKAGDIFQCTGSPTIGGTVEVEVTQKDDKGTIEWKVTRSTGLFDLGEAEAAVARGIHDQLGADVKVSCGDRWQLGKAGDTFECRGEDADGTASTVVIFVKDAEGNISWALK
ncbi:MAG: DUF4333 domain-containing protein [Thermoanaerobaculia bacterium]